MRKLGSFIFGLLAAVGLSVGAQEIGLIQSLPLSDLLAGTAPAGSGTYAFGANPVTGSAFGITGGTIDGTVIGGVTTAGAAFTSLSASSAFTEGSSSAAAPVIQINGATATNRIMQFLTAGSARWKWIATNTAESGSNVGTNLSINAYDDSGTLIDTPMMLNRASGTPVSFARHLGSTGAAPSVTGTGCAASATPAPTDTRGAITATAATSCTVTFAATYTSVPVCVATASSTTIPTSIASVSATAVTFGMAALTGTVYYWCVK